CRQMRRTGTVDLVVVHDDQIKRGRGTAGGDRDRRARLDDGGIITRERHDNIDGRRGAHGYRAAEVGRAFAGGGRQRDGQRGRFVVLHGNRGGGGAPPRSRAGDPEAARSIEDRIINGREHEGRGGLAGRK